MNRFIFSPEAAGDLDAVIAYLDSLPDAPAVRLGASLQQTIYSLAKSPQLGRLHEEFSSLAHEEIRRFISEGYVLFYAPARQVVVFVGILHGARDVGTIMRARLG